MAAEHYWRVQGGEAAYVGRVGCALLGRSSCCVCLVAVTRCVACTGLYLGSRCKFCCGRTARTVGIEFFGFCVSGQLAGWGLCMVTCACQAGCSRVLLWCHCHDTGLMTYLKRLGVHASHLKAGDVAFWLFTLRTRTVLMSARPFSE